MGPAILARAAVAPFAAKVHGSALEYTVKPHPRFLPYADEGMEAATGVLVGSRHTAESLWAALPDLPDLERRPASARPASTSRSSAPRAGRARADPLVVFVGKLIVSKGVDLLLAAWPLVRAAHPGARLQIAGFGEYEDGLRRLLAALERGDLDDAREVARLGRGLEGGRGGAAADPLRLPRRPARRATPRRPAPPPARSSSSAASSTTRSPSCCPRAEALVMPSTFPEAFGMVAVEAAACGALPVSAGHSGMLEVSRAARRGAARRRSAALTSFPVEAGRGRGDRRPARRLAGAARGRARERAARTLVETVARLWSWEGVARGVLAAAAGDLGDLPRPGS